jgi:hypothetical protein
MNPNPDIKNALVRIKIRNDESGNATLVSRKTRIQKRAKIFTQTFLLKNGALFKKNLNFSFLLNTQKSWKIFILLSDLAVILEGSKHTRLR